MKLENFMLLTQQQELNSSVTETTDPFQHQPLDYSSWKGETNIEANYWVLITVPLLLIVAFLFEVRKKYVPPKKVEPAKASDLPCYHCQYFNQNPYIKCAVNPVTALTKEAHECKDFQTKQEDSQ